MAGEIGHTVYAARILSRLKDKVSTPAYWVGTLFPDIRHLGVISRQHTHLRDITLNSLVGSSDFETGLRVHAWVDVTRSEFLETLNIKEMLFWHPFVPHALKLIEDEMLYDRFSDWELVRQALKRVQEAELEYVQTRDHVEKWHEVLRDYFHKKPTDESRYKLALAIGLGKGSAVEMNKVVRKLQSDETTAHVIERILEHFEFLLQ